MKYFESIFIYYNKPFHPKLQTSAERPAVRDTPVNPQGLVRFTRPLETPKANSFAIRIIEDIRFFYTNGYMRGQMLTAAEMDQEDQESHIRQLEAESAADRARLAMLGFNHELQR